MPKRNSKKPSSPISPKVNPVYASADPPVTATLRRMPINPLARNSSRRVVPIATPTSPPIAPSVAPPPLPPLPLNRSCASLPRRSSSNCNEAGDYNDINNHQRPSGSSHLSEIIAWPSDSLPRRVKKLSWEDEYNVFF